MAYPKFSGTGVALVTPFAIDGSIDFTALKQLVDHCIDGGVDFLVALGTTAETPTLSQEEKAAVLATIVAQNNRRVPLVCGVGGNNTAEVVAHLQPFHLQGVDAILSVAPYYNKPTQEGIYRHFKAIAAATELPVILYNVPGRTVTNILPQTVLRIAADCPNVIAIKEASGNLAQCMELIAARPEGFTVLSGDDNLVVPQIAVGMEGVISVAANCYTRLFCGMVKAALGGDFSQARSLHYKLLKGIDLLFAEGNPAGVKAVLAQMGLIQNVVRLPLVEASESLQAALMAEGLV